MVCLRARTKIKKREGGRRRESVCGSQLLVDELKYEEILFQALRYRTSSADNMTGLS